MLPKISQKYFDTTKFAIVIIYTYLNCNFSNITSNIPISSSFSTSRHSIKLKLALSLMTFKIDWQYYYDNLINYLKYLEQYIILKKWNIGTQNWKPWLFLVSLSQKFLNCLESDCFKQPTKFLHYLPRNFMHRAWFPEENNHSFTIAYTQFI